MVRSTSLVRSLIIGALCVVLAAATGCSALRLGYSQAPDLAYWWLDGYADFNGAQTPKVRDALDQWFAWHRRTQLPDYANLLARAKAEMAVDTSAARVCEWQGELIKRAHVAWDRAAPAVAEVVLTVTPQQIQHLEKRQAKSNADFRDDYLQADPRKRADEAVKRTVDRLETLYGKLNEGQRTYLAEALARSPFDADAWYGERLRRQQAMVAMLQQANGDGTSREQAMAALNLQVEQFEHSPRDAYRRYSERLNEFNCSLAASLHNSTTPAQRKHAAQKLAGWEGDARALVAAAK